MNIKAKHRPRSKTASNAAATRTAPQVQAELARSAPCPSGFDTPAGVSPSPLRFTPLAEALHAGGALLPTLLELAATGEAAAIDRILELLLQARNQRRVRIALPPIDDTDDVARVYATLAQALRLGILTVDNAALLARSATEYFRALHWRDLKELQHLLVESAEGIGEGGARLGEPYLAPGPSAVSRRIR